jgi:hypothetical protein
VFVGGQGRTRRVHDKARSGFGGLSHSEFGALVNWGLVLLLVFFMCEAQDFICFSKGLC